jgi:ankyrin repeat protein|eukprot:jgi/Chrpa1/8542/Chrysochromulina_OHIO_Genome00017168-RA
MRNEPRELESMLRAYAISINRRVTSTATASRYRRDVDGDRFPIHWAAARGAIPCAHMLIDACASISALDANGETAADLAELAADLAADLAVVSRSRPRLISRRG